MTRLLASILLLITVSGCMTIGGYNRATPHDPGAVRVAASERYGEGPRRTLDVYAPAQRTEALPVIVFLYGGGWSSGAKEDYSFVGDAFAAHGFVAIVPDYRVYPEVRFPGFVEDAGAALHWVQENAVRYGGDPDRIVLVGHSAGAHIAMLAALDPRYAEAAGFDRAAIRGVVGLAGPYGFDNFDAPLLRNVFGDVIDPLTTMPRHYARQGGPPLLLLHGERDRRVPVYSSTRMHETARDVGQAAELKIYPNLDHPGILQALAIARRDEASVFEDTLGFARRVTGGREAAR